MIRSRPPRHVASRRLALLAFALTLAACRGGEQAASGPPRGAVAERAPESSQPIATAPVMGAASCDTYGFGTSNEGLLGLKPGDRGSLPADFPEPPEGARLCGSNEMDTTFYTGGGPGQALLEHYRARLTEQGYAVDAIDPGMEEGDLEMSFRKADAASGSVYADKDGTFSVVYTALR